MGFKYQPGCTKNKDQIFKLMEVSSMFQFHVCVTIWQHFKKRSSSLQLSTKLMSQMTFWRFLFPPQTRAGRLSGNVVIKSVLMESAYYDLRPICMANQKSDFAVWFNANAFSWSWFCKKIQILKWNKALWKCNNGGI